MKKIIICSIILIAIIACKNENHENHKLENLKSNSAVIDTVIRLSDISLSKSQEKINEDEAKEFLYRYFKNQGALPRHEIENYSNGGLCIDYDTIYNLTGTENSVIRYWLNPADLNGTCVQPKMAIISKTKSGIKISNEEFINSNFFIDSIGKDLSLYGYDWDCSDKKVLRNRKIILENK